MPIMPARDHRLLSRRPRNPGRPLRNIETELATLWALAAGSRRAALDLENSARHPHCAGQSGRRAPRPGGRIAWGPVLENRYRAGFPCRGDRRAQGRDDQDRRITAESIGNFVALARSGCRRPVPSGSYSAPGRNAVDLIPGAVRPLLEADLPLVLWWTGDPPDASTRRSFATCSRPSARGWSSICPTLPQAGCVRLGLDPALYAAATSAWFGRARWRAGLPSSSTRPCRSDSLSRIAAVADRGPVVRSGPTAPAGDLAGGVAGRSARLEATRPTL